MMDIFRHMDNHINILKSEKEFLAKQLQRIETKTYSHQGSKDRVVAFEADTQTETDEDLSLSILNESLSSRNKELEEEITNLKERIKQEATQTGGNILTNVACKVLLPQTKSDKYIPSGTEEQNSKDLQSEYEQLLSENDICTEEIRKLGNKLNLEKQEHVLTKEHTKNRIEDLENQIKTLQGQWRKSETDTNKMAIDIEGFHEKSKKDEETIKMFKIEMSEKINKIQEQETRIQKQETRIQELGNEIEQNKKLINDIITETTSKDQKTEESNLIIVQLKGKLDTIENKLQEMQQANTKLEDFNKEIRNKNSSAEKAISDLEKCVTDRDAMVTDLKKKLSQLDEQYTIRGQAIEEKKVYLEELKIQIQNKESELSTFKQNMEKDIKKLKNELSLEAVNFQNEKIKTKDLENKVVQLNERISDLNLTNNKLETDLEIKESTTTQEKVKLQETVINRAVK
ncbi:unnamed protein product [Mytilus edulis]|uniref:Uncharacterized protein n=1 Tax=Mytilus edulis TaxID=6550 RepID=A0A8S3V702_MYTED|nr:unnamed protein product [Mytilus edulis]